MKSIIKLICCLWLFHFALGAHLPETINICKRSDPNFEKCVPPNIEAALKVFANGDKNFGLVPLEPLFIKKMSAVTHGKVDLEEVYTDMNIYGLINSKIERFKFDYDKCKIEIDSNSPRISIYAQYKLKGKMSLFDVNGHGGTNQTLSNLKIKHLLSCEKFTKDGEEYIRIKDYITDFYDYDLKLHFENLIPNNPELSKEVGAVVNENSNAIFGETKVTYQKSYAELFKQLANSVFEHIPLKEIFPN